MNVIHSHEAKLPAPEPIKPSDCSLSQLIDFLELDIRTLTPGAIDILIASRNSGKYLKGMNIPRGRTPDELAEEMLIQRESAERIRTNRPVIQSVPIPSDDFSIRLIRGIEELPRVVPSDLAIAKFAPNLFYQQLADHSLRCIEFQSERETLTEDTSRSGDLVVGHADEHINHAVVLLDTSATMGYKDKRGAIARGLSLQFLCRAYEQNAHLGLAPFSSSLGEVTKGFGLESLQESVKKLLNLPNAGNTNLQGSLVEILNLIRSGGAFNSASILLVTDGVSALRMEEPPFGPKEKLYSYVLSDVSPIWPSSMRSELEDHRSTLRIWSINGGYTEISNLQIKEDLIPSVADIECFASLLKTLPGELTNAISTGEIEKVKNATTNVRYLIESYQHGSGEGGKNFTDMEAELRDLEEKLVQIGATEQIKLNQEQMGAEEFQRRQDLVEAERLLQSTLSGNSTNERSMESGMAGGSLFGNSPSAILELFRMFIRKCSEMKQGIYEWLKFKD